LVEEGVLSLEAKAEETVEDRALARREEGSSSPFVSKVVQSSSRRSVNVPREGRGRSHHVATRARVCSHASINCSSVVVA